MFCRNCGSKIELKEDVLFCMNCGAALSDDTISKFCTCCGTNIDKNSKFCIKCGNQLPKSEVLTNAKIMIFTILIVFLIIIGLL